MTAARPTLSDLPTWPRMMGRETAAAYLGVSPGTIETVYEVAPVPMKGRRVLFDRHDLDEAIERLKGKRQYAGDPVMEAIYASANAIR